MTTGKKLRVDSRPRPQDDNDATFNPVFSLSVGLSSVIIWVSVILAVCAVASHRSRPLRTPLTSRANVVLKRTVNNLSRSHLQSNVDDIWLVYHINVSAFVTVWSVIGGADYGQ